MLATLLERARKAREDESGFTLIELLIVIVILGILAGIVVFAVGGVTDRGTKAACQSDLKSVEVAAEAYFAQNGAYPADDAAAQTDLVPGFLHSYPDTVTYTKVGTSFTVAGASGASRDCTGITVS